MEKGTSLPDTQLEVMQVIWDKGGTIMFGELSEELEDRGREWKPNTVLTLLSRLAERGMITVCKRSANSLPLYCPGYKGGISTEAGVYSGGAGVWRRYQASDLCPCKAGLPDKRGL